MSSARILDRNTAVPALIGDPDHFLIVAGLAGSARDIAAATHEGDNTYLLGGAMGAGIPMAFGLALAQPQRRVLAVTGDGDLMMSLGVLATIGIVKPANLAILCVDNGHYGETGYQEGHTNRGVDLATIAQGSGIAITHTVNSEADFTGAGDALRESNAPVFVWLRVDTTPAPKYKRNLDAAERKAIFRRALLGTR